MYLTKYYSFKTKENIYKIVLGESELKTMKLAIAQQNLIRYEEIAIKKFDYIEEMKYANSPNSIGITAIQNINSSEERYFIVETDEKKFFAIISSVMFECQALRVGNELLTQLIDKFTNP